jgi:hypothetical protein
MGWVLLELRQPEVVQMAHRQQEGPQGVALVVHFHQLVVERLEFLSS